MFTGPEAREVYVAPVDDDAAATDPDVTSYDGGNNGDGDHDTASEVSTVSTDSFTTDVNVPAVEVVAQVVAPTAVQAVDLAVAPVIAVTPVVPTDVAAAAATDPAVMSYVDAARGLVAPVGNGDIHIVLDAKPAEVVYVIDDTGDDDAATGPDVIGDMAIVLYDAQFAHAQMFANVSHLLDRRLNNDENVADIFRTMTLPELRQLKIDLPAFRKVFCYGYNRTYYHNDIVGEIANIISIMQSRSHEVDALHDRLEQLQHLEAIDEERLEYFQVQFAYQEVEATYDAVSAKLTHLDNRDKEYQSDWKYEPHQDTSDM